VISLFKGSAREWLRQNLPRVPLLVNLAWGLFRDPRVPTSLKAGLLGVLVYVASPIDLIPDFIPIIGLADDLFLLLAAMDMFVRLAPPEVVEDLEKKYWEGHGPLRADLAQAERHFGRLWSWAVQKLEHKAREYTDRVKDQTFVRNIERKSRNRP
jgi:uncharacterized membrane protein YkvA (DUF1232 family)